MNLSLRLVFSEVTLEGQTHAQAPVPCSNWLYMGVWTPNGDKGMRVRGQDGLKSHRSMTPHSGDLHLTNSVSDRFACS